MNIKFFNCSQVFGGQENYLIKLFKSLDSHDVDYFFSGTPLTEIDGRKKSLIKVNVFNGNKALYNNFIKYFFDNNCIYIQHSDINDSQGPIYKKIIRKFLLYLCLKRVDAVIRVCNKCIPDKYAKGKITTVYNGVELKTEVPRELSGKLNLLMVGAINDNKNQKLAIEALVHIKDATLTLVGSGADLESLKSLEIGRAHV